MTCLLSLPYVSMYMHTWGYATAVKELNKCVRKMTRKQGKIFLYQKSISEDFLCSFMRDEFIMTFNICTTEWEFFLYYVGKFTKSVIQTSNHSRMPQNLSPHFVRILWFSKSSLSIHHIFKFRHDNAHPFRIVLICIFKQNKGFNSLIINQKKLYNFKNNFPLIFH
jgi:hypothetical protein